MSFSHYEIETINKLMKTDMFQTIRNAPKEWHVIQGPSKIDLVYSLNHFGMVEIDPFFPRGSFSVSAKLNPCFIERIQDIKELEHA